MTAGEAVQWVDDKLPNPYSLQDKLAWLEQAEQMARALERRCGLPGEGGELTVRSSLRIPPPYDPLYLRWLEAQIHYTNQEYLKYNNAMAMFMALWQEYSGGLRRNAQAGPVRFRFFGEV